MDRLNLLRGSLGPAPPFDDSGTSDTGFQTASESSSTKYFSCSDSEPDASPTPTKSLHPNVGSTPITKNPDSNMNQDVILKLSPIINAESTLSGKIEATNILSGGIDIFDDNSYDDELVIDDNVTCDSNEDSKSNDVTLEHTKTFEKVICEPIESVNLSLSIDDHITLKDLTDKDIDPCSSQDSTDCRMETDLMDSSVTTNEVILQIDGNNVDAIDIGNGLYLYRKDEGEDLMAIQILQEAGDQQPQFKFLKVRQNDDGNLEVYEEQIHEVPLTDEEMEEEKRKAKKEKEKQNVRPDSRLPVKDLTRVINQPVSVKSTTLTSNTSTKEDKPGMNDQKTKPCNFGIIKSESDSKLIANPLKNLEGSRKSPILGSFTSMTLHSSPREGLPLTKTMVNLQLNPCRHSDAVKKTIELSTDHSKVKPGDKCMVSRIAPVEEKTLDQPNKNMDTHVNTKIVEPNLNSSNLLNATKQEINSDCISRELINVAKSTNLESIIKSPNKDVNNFDLEKPQTKSVSDLNIANEIETIQQDIDSELKSDKLDNKIKALLTEIKPISNKPKYASEIITKDLNANKHKTYFNAPYTNKKISNTEAKIDTYKNINKYNQRANPSSKDITSDETKNQNNLTKTTNKCESVIRDKTQKVSHVTDNCRNTLVENEHQSKGEYLNESSKEMKEDQKNVNNEKVNVFKDNKFMNKYISEALGVKNITESTIESLKSDPNMSLKPDIDAMSKIIPHEKPVSTQESKIPFTLPVRISVEISKKPVPFGKWTEADKKGYLNKLKDHKVPSSNPSSSPVKSYQLASTKNNMKRLEQKKKVESFENLHLSNNKLDVATVSRQDSNEVKKEVPGTFNDVDANNPTEAESADKESNDDKTRPNDLNSLINKTIEGIIMETLLRTSNDLSIRSLEQAKPPSGRKSPEKISIDELERQMNELHGVPFVEKPHAGKSSSRKSNDRFTTKSESPNSKIPLSDKVDKIPKLLPLSSSTTIGSTSKHNLPCMNEDEHSEEEILDCEPVTGDSAVPWSQNNRNQTSKEHKLRTEKPEPINSNKKGITEVEFDKFVRRNSTSLENKLKLEIPAKPQAHAVDTKHQYRKSNQTVNTTSAPNIVQYDSKTKPTTVHAPRTVYAGKREPTKPVESNVYSLQADDTSQNSNYTTKIQMAYQSAVTSIRQDPPVKVIDNTPLKVVFLESTTKHISSPANLPKGENFDSIPCASIISEVSFSQDEEKVVGTITTKIKHPRKQVLTPVESPDLEIIEPDNTDATQKKRRKAEHKKSEENVTKKDFKSLLHKKSYLLGRATSVTEEIKSFDAENSTCIEKDKSNYKINVESPISLDESRYTKPKSTIHVGKETNTQHSMHSHGETNIPGDKKSPADNFQNPVDKSKSPENQTQYILDKSRKDCEVQDTPKRGRGRPRKHPAQNVTEVTQKSVSPKKRKLSESTSSQEQSITSDEDSDEEGIPRENWTMGKIDEKIVCPICNKLFRSENVVFKHVKHCSSLSDSKRHSSSESSYSPKKTRLERYADKESSRNNPKVGDENAKNNMKNTKESTVAEPSKLNQDDSVIIIGSPKTDQVIIIEDSPDVTSKPNEENTKLKPKNKIGRPRSNPSLTCEICGKTFRQLSYLINHRAIHDKESQKTISGVDRVGILRCEVCHKDFRKLHHLVEHREIHNTNTTAEVQRKASIDRTEIKQNEADLNPKPEGHPAGFRCEPCDKSFRKLHHLVEHRESHGGVHRLKSPAPTQVSPPEKTVTESPTCDVCGKSFRKLHHLIEHREQHSDLTKEKVDERKQEDVSKEKKPSLIAKDIIHECSLCYMVFPNEPSLNKHFGNCQKKKKPSMVRKSTEIPVRRSTEILVRKSTEPPVQVTIEVPVRKSTEIPVCKPAEVHDKENKEMAKEGNVLIQSAKIQKTPIQTVESPAIVEEGRVAGPLKTKRNSNETASDTHSLIPVKIKKLNEKPKQTPKKKVPKPAKIGATVTKRSAESRGLLPIVDETLESTTKSIDSEDDVRYMFNPLYDQESEEEREIFMNIRQAKRNSLQFDSPKKDALKLRRTSLQHTPKLQRTVPKKIEKFSKPPVLPSVEESVPKTKLTRPQVKASASIPISSAEDSEIKYSFPRSSKTDKPRRKSSTTPKNEDSEQTNSKKSEKRKSLTGFAKRKSLGKSAVIKPKSNFNNEAVIKKVIKRQASEAQHVCDCGKPFNSAALLARHTSLDHTPPRIRKPRNPDTDLPTNKAGKKKLLVTKKTPHAGVPVPVKADFFKKLRNE